MTAPVIWKYDVPVQSEPIVLSFPTIGTPLALQMQGDGPKLWVKVWPMADYEKDPRYLDLRAFRWFATGEPLPERDLIAYVGTVQHNGLVFHLFEVKLSEEDLVRQATTEAGNRFPSHYMRQEYLAFLQALLDRYKE